MMMNQAAGFSLSSCLLNSTAQGSPLDERRNPLSWQETISEPRNSSLLLLYSRKAKLANYKESDTPVLVQTRAQRGEPSSDMRLPKQKRKRKDKRQNEAEVVVGKQRQSPLSSWIGKQFVGQNISKRHLDKDGKLTMMEGYSHALFDHSIGWILRAEDSCSSE
jgi:hypothetical protein